MKISSRDLYGAERIVAQLIANNVEEYGLYLNNTLSKMREGFWDDEQSISYGNELKNWATNSREYNWLLATFPNETPKSKGAYTNAKHRKSPKYLMLKHLADSMGYELNDHT